MSYGRVRERPTNSKQIENNLCVVSSFLKINPKILLITFFCTYSKIYKEMILILLSNWQKDFLNLIDCMYKSCYSFLKEAQNNDE